jgi:hypothetical protein
MVEPSLNCLSIDLVARYRKMAENGALSRRGTISLAEAGAI